MTNFLTTRDHRDYFRVLAEFKDVTTWCTSYLIFYVLVVSLIYFMCSLSPLCARCPPPFPIPDITIQYIDFINFNDRFSEDKIISKTAKYQPFLNNIQARGWTVVPLIVITAGTQASTHTSSIKILHKTFGIPLPLIKQTLSNININAIYYAISILLHKQRIENNQPISTFQNFNDT
jgi:hypothetical protein